MKTDKYGKEDIINMHFVTEEYINADEEIRKEIINLVLNLKWEVSHEEN